MAEFTAHPMAWAEEHPYISAGIVVGGIVVLYWLFFSGGSKSGGDAGQTQMAAAYYAAEAAQATAGTQLNIATEQADAQVKVAAIQAGGAVAINAANAKASTDIASSMYAADMQDTATTTAGATAQAGIWAGAQTQQALYSAQTQQVQANDAMTTATTAAAYNYATVVSNNNTSEAIDFINTVLPQEFATYGQNGFTTGLPSGQSFSSGVWGNPNIARAVGYSEPAVAKMFNFP